MAILNSENSVVMIIDVQEKLLNAVFNKTSLEKKAEIITKSANILNIPVIVTEQYPKGLGYTIEGIRSVLPQDMVYYDKTAFSALENPEVVKALEFLGKKQVVLFGIETHICVSQTAEALIKAGYEVHVVKDACGSRAELEYSAGLARMQDNGAHIITTEIAVFEWLKSAKHPNFKDVQTLIK